MYNVFRNKHTYFIGCFIAKPTYLFSVEMYFAIEQHSLDMHLTRHLVQIRQGCR